MSTNTTQPAAKSEIPKDLLPAFDAHFTQNFESAFAAKMATLPTQQPRISDVKDLQLDVPKEKLLYAHLGLRLKTKYMERAKASQQATGEHWDKLDKFLMRTKAAGQFASVYEQGGNFLRETVSSELVELVRPNSILMRAGVRSVSGYGAKLTMGTQDSGVQVYWAAEGQPATTSTVQGGAISLTAHKVIARARLSNDLLRLGTLDSAALLGQDMAAALALEVDIVGLKGKGPKKPNGVREQMDATYRTASAGASVANKIADTDDLMSRVEKANVPGGLAANGAFYYMDTDTYYALRSTRDAAGWVFPELRDATNPRLNGFPVLRSETLAGDEVLGFGLAAQLIFGEAVPLELATGEDGNDFSSDMFTMRGVTEVDWLLRYRKAFAEKTGVDY